MLTIFFFLIISFCYSRADCPDRLLYCFDSNDSRIGSINVNQCWKWSMLSCIPCSAIITSDSRRLSYYKYIHHCRYYFPDSVTVLDSKNVLIKRLRDVVREMAFG